MRVKSHMILPAAIMIVAVFAVITAALRVWQVASWNDSYHEMYEKHGDGTSEYFVEPGTTAEYLEPFGSDYAESLVTPKSGVATLTGKLDYYDAPDGNIVLTLEQGNYLLAGDDSAANNFYGDRSFPAMVKGWRYVRPFIKEGETLGEGLFVKTKDLLEVSESIYPESKENVPTALNFGEFGVVKEQSPYAFEFFRNDQELYSDSAYCSADLEEPLFDTRTAVTGIAGILLIGWAIVVFIVRNREENARIAAEAEKEAQAHAEAKAKHDEWMRTRAEKNRAKGKKKR